MLRWFCLALTLFLSASPAPAAPVELDLPGNLVAKAEFRPGDPHKPAVLLLHGFLQTHEFPTIHRLAEGLASAGYTVLAPSLTLGVTHRKQSLACEAIHTHSMDSAVGEITAWVGWLKAKGIKSIVLMGHSFGNVQLLAYLDGHPDPAVRKYIGISIFEASSKAGEGRDQVVRELRARIKAGDRRLIVHPFSFCQKFQATPDSMLSYLEWTPNRILKTANRLRIPGVFIMGGRDERLGPNWIPRLQMTRAKVRVIAGANHFMDGEYEFDLMDILLSELK